MVSCFRFLQMASAASSLNVGKLHKILVTSVARSAHIFVQLDTDDAYSLPQLSERIQADAAASAPPLTSHWSRGDDCVALYVATNDWYRAHVTAVHRDGVDVFFFDYGNCDTVANDKVRPLKPQFSKLPAQAVECILGGVEPAGGQLNDEGFTAMSEALLDAEFTAKVTGKESNNVVTIEIVDDSGRPLEIVENFVRRKFLRKSGGGSLREGETYDVYVACVADPPDFWIQLESNTEKLEALMERVEELYSQPGRPSVPAHPGSLCCTQYSQDGAWYRAEVMQVQGTKARVRFIDYGNSEVVNTSELKQLDQSLASEPLAVCCALAGAEPVTGSQWSKDVLQEFSSLILDKPLKCTVEKVGKTVTVTLVDASNGRRVIDEMLARNLVHVRTGVGDKTAQYSSLNLTKNQQQEVYVTSVENPSRFWCQLAGSTDDIESLMASLADHYSPKRQASLTSLQPGTPCCGQFTEDDAWYRAVVTATEPGNKVKVQYVDYGNQETLPLSRVLALDRKFMQLPVQAVSCGIDGLRPPAGSNWRPEAARKLEDLAAGSVTAIIKAVREETSDGWTKKHVMVDIIFMREGLKVSVADQLVRAGVAVTEGQPVAVQTQAVSIKQEALREKEMVEVEVTFAVDPGEFWCYSHTGGTALVPVMEALKAHCESPSAQRLKQVQAGALCGARYSADGEWYRGRVERVAGSGTASVYFLDYGNSDDVAVSDLRAMSAQLVSLPAQAVKCSLKDVHPAGGSSWSQAAVDVFQELVSDRGLFACAVGQTRDGVFEVKLFDTSSDEDLDVGQELVKKGVARGPMSGQQTQTARQPAGSQKQRMQSVAAGQSLSMTIVSVENPQSFWCQLIDEKPQADLEKVMAEMSDQYSQMRPGQDTIQTFRVGQMLAAQYTEDDAWYRAEVAAVRGNLVEVRYVDYGNSETLLPERLRALLPSFRSLSPIAVCCQLYGVAPKGSVWVPEAGRELETLGKDKTLIANIKSVDSQRKATVELLEGDVSLADRLVAQGYAAKAGAGRQKTPLATIERKREQSPATPKQQAPTFKYGVQNLRVGQVEKMVVAYVTSPSEIWCQSPSGQETLERMQSAIQTVYGRLRPGKGDLDGVAGGVACVAQSPADSMWYRAVISRVLAQGDIEVQYVDYGNLEVVPKKFVKMVHRDFKGVPAQAIRCGLSQCPEPTGGWTDKDRDALDILVADVELTGDVKSVQGNPQVFNLEMTFYKNGRKVNVRDEFLSATGRGVTSTVRSPPPPAQQVTTVKSPPRVDRVAPSPPRQVETVKIELNGPTVRIGSFEDVCIVGVKTVDQMWCQLVKMGPKLAQLGAKMVSYAKTISQALSQPSVGQFCLAQYSDGAYYRGHVKSVHSDGKVEVFYVDYGNVETVSSSTLKPIDGELCVLPAQAFTCRLAGVKPKQPGRWSQEASAYLEQLTIGKQLVARRVQAHDLAIELFDTSDKQSDVKIAGELVKAGLAVYDGALETAQQQAVINPTHLLPGKEYHVLVTHVSSPLKFFCQIQKDADEFAVMTDQLYTYCSGLGEGQGGAGPMESAVGQFVAALYSLDGGWYRAKVTSIENRQAQTVHVFFVDYGNEETVSWSSVKCLTRSFTKIHALCFEACLDIAAKDVSSEDVERFKRTVADKEFSCRVFSSHGEGRNAVQLLRRDKGTNVADELGFKAKVLQPRAPPGRSLEYTHPRLVEGVTVKVFGTVCEEFGRFWCQMSDRVPQLETLMAEIEDYYAGLGTNDQSLNVAPAGLACCAKFSKDEAWYRAQIKNSRGTDVSVLYVDYGNSETIPLSDLKVLNPKFADLPAQAIQCRLANACSSDRVPPDSVAQYEQLIQDQELDILVKSVSGRGHAEVDIPSLTERLQELGVIKATTSPAAEQVNSCDRGTLVKLEQPEVTEGNVDSVYLSHIINPGQFYCQRVSSEGQLSALMDQVAQYCSIPAVPVLRSRAVGSPCVAKYSEDEQFYRAEIERVGESSCDVVFVDYGNCGTVEFVDIKEISPSLLQLPVLCIQCRLSGTQGHQWETNATDRLSELVQGDAVNCHFVEQIKGVWDVDIETAAGSVKSDLIGRHLLPAPAGSLASGEISIPQIKMATDTAVGALMSAVIDPETFYIQLESQAEELNCLMERLAESYVSLAEDDLVLQSPVEGMACCAQFSADQQWYRATAVRITGIDCEVLFVDYGNQETVPLSRVKELKAELAAIPAQAVLCSLDGVKPSGSGWSKDAVTAFEEFTIEKQLTAKAVGKTGGKYVTQIIDAETHESVSDRLLSTGHAIAVDEVPTAGSAVGPTVSDGVAAAIEDDSDSVATPDGAMLDSFASLQPVVGEVFDAKVVLVDSPDSFFCHLVSSAAELETVMERLAIACTESAPSCFPKEQLLAKAACAARYSVDEGWYRAKIINVVEGNATVLFVDYGNMETVSIDELQPLSPELRTLPAQALYCCLADVVAPKVDEGWSDQAHTALEELSADITVSCTIVSIQPEGVYEVRLINTETGESLQEQLIARGVVVSEMAEQGTSEVLRWQTGTSVSEQAAEGSVPGHSPSLEVDRSVRDAEPEESRYEIQPDITRDVTERGIEDGVQCEHQASPMPPDVVTNRATDDDYATESSPPVQPDVVVAQVDLIAKPLAEPEIPPEEPDIQKSVRLSQQEDAATLPQVTVSELHVTDAITGQPVSAEVTVSIEAVDEDEAVEAERFRPDDKIAISSIVVAEVVEAVPEPTDRPESEDEQAIAGALVESVIQSAVDFVENQRDEDRQQAAASVLELVLDRVVDELARDSSLSQSSDEKPGDEDFQQVIITFVEDDGRFWARIGYDEDHQEYAELVEKMNDHYGPLEVPEDESEAVDGEEEPPTKTTSTGKFSVNDLCAVPWLEDGQWYRGKVMGLISYLSEGDSVMLQLIDSGQITTVPLALIRPLVPPFGIAPEFATYCSLAGIEPGSDGWSNEAKVFLSDLSTDKLIYGHVENTDDSQVTPLHLFAPSEELKGWSFQIYSSQLPLIAKGGSSGAPSEVDSMRVEIGSFREPQDNTSISSFGGGERGSPPLPVLAEDREIPAVPTVNIEDTDGPNGDDRLSPSVCSSRVSDVVRKPQGYVYVNKLMVDQGLAKFTV